MKGEIEESLLEKARIEKKVYNFEEAAELYGQAAKIFPNSPKSMQFFKSIL